MSAYECWQQQKEKLRAELGPDTELSSAAYLTRHAVAQVEQSVLAAQTDDVLRQQAGVLFAGLKSAVGLMDVATGAKVWVAQSARQTPKKKGAAFFGCLAVAAQLAVGLLAYTRKEPLLWIGMLAALALGALCVIALRRAKPVLPQDEVRVTLHPDADKLLRTLDAQMQSVDRYLNDFAYLNETLGGKSALPDRQTMDSVADMLEAIADQQDGSPAMEAATRMLDGLGLTAVSFDGKNQQLFTLLPSKEETRTLSPALLAKEDGRLIRRGAATKRVEPDAQ